MGQLIGGKDLALTTRVWLHCARPAGGDGDEWNLLLSTRNGIPAIPVVDALPGNLDLHLANHQYKYVPSLKSSVFFRDLFHIFSQIFLKICQV